MPSKTLTMDADYYGLLRVDPKADLLTIRNAWASEQRLWGVRQNAPDLATRHAAERHVQLLGKVKDVLLDPQRRAKYDRERAQPTVTIAPRAPALAEHVADSAEPVVMHRGYAARHPELLKPVAVGLAGGLITGSQVFHWDFALMMAVGSLLCMLVYAFNILGLRSAAWTFRTRARGVASMVVLSALTLGFGLRVLFDLVRS
jgi:hypothetical protein